MYLIAYVCMYCLALFSFQLICDKEHGLRVVGFHVLGPNAGEITQGFAVAMRLGATYAHFMDTVGIHPTTAEEFTTLSVTRSSGESADKGGC
jgi:pyruvate/2-oxoglutarate dehydrogenase complex dihydrolipoamide dehydrogenase (E3) component